MKKNSILLLLCFALNLSAYASYDLDGPFDEIRVSGKVRLILEPGEEEAVEILSDADKVSYEVREGVLVVKRKERWKYSSYKRSVKVVVTYKTLRKISAEAGAEVRSGSVLNTTDALRLYFGTGARAELAINVSDLEVSTGEGAVLELEGAAEELTLRASTGGVVEAFDLKTDRAYVRANLGGSAEIAVDKTLEAKAHTGGIIEYQGDPQRMNISDDLGGEVKSIGI